MKIVSLNLSDNFCMYGYDVCWIQHTFDQTIEMMNTHTFRQELPDLTFMVGELQYRLSYDENNQSTLFNAICQTQLNAIRTDASVFMILVFTKEWHDLVKNIPYYEHIKSSCKKYNIPMNKIILLHGNPYDDNAKTTDYLKKEGITVNRYYLPGYEGCYHADVDFESRYKQVYENVDNISNDKYFLHLTKNPRIHKTIVTQMLYNSPAFANAMVSHPKINYYQHQFNNLFSKENTKKFLESLPFLVDEVSNNTAMCYDFTASLFNRAIFSINIETEVENDDVRLALTEKTLKPHAHILPAISLSGRGIHNVVKNTLGYKLFEDIFDYSFDDDPNYISRYKNILVQVESLCKELNKKNKYQKLDWRFKHIDVLQYNYNRQRHKIAQQMSLIKMVYDTVLLSESLKITEIHT